MPAGSSRTATASGRQTTSAGTGMDLGDASAAEEAKKAELDALKKEEDDFAKLEAAFIAELSLTSAELPKYAQHLGVDVAVEKSKESKK